MRFYCILFKIVYWNKETYTLNDIYDTVKVWNDDMCKIGMYTDHVLHCPIIAMHTPRN